MATSTVLLHRKGALFSLSAPPLPPGEETGSSSAPSGGDSSFGLLNSPFFFFPPSGNVSGNSRVPVGETGVNRGRA